MIIASPIFSCINFIGLFTARDVSLATHMEYKNGILSGNILHRCIRGSVQPPAKMAFEDSFQYMCPSLSCPKGRSRIAACSTVASWSSCSMDCSPWSFRLSIISLCSSKVKLDPLQEIISHTCFHCSGKEGSRHLCSQKPIKDCEPSRYKTMKNSSHCEDEWRLFRVRQLLEASWSAEIIQTLHCLRTKISCPCH